MGGKNVGDRQSMDRHVTGSLSTRAADPPRRERWDVNARDDGPRGS